MPAAGAAMLARRAIPLLDLTDLSESCDAPAIDRLCRSARQWGVAAVCVRPRFVAQAAPSLEGSGIPVATAVNFPQGGEDVALTRAETRKVLDDGAREIDLVLPYRAFLRGEERLAGAMVEAVRGVCGREHPLKVILETGAFPDLEAIGAASRLALAAGADFLKTSTGKIPVSASPEAAEAMLRAIRAFEARSAGLKVSGGLRSASDAARYLALADRIMGTDWVSPRTFRLGASSLLGALTEALEPEA